MYAWVPIVLGITILTSYFNLRIPFFGIRSLTFLSATFFLIGYCIKKIKLGSNKVYQTILCFIIVAIGSVFCHTSMLSFTTDKILPYTICAICGIIMILNVSQYITSKDGWIKNILIYIGNNTLIILTWHFLCFKIVSLGIITVNNLPIEQLAYFPIIPQYTSHWIIYFVIGTGIPLTIHALMHRIIHKRLSKPLC